jgi:hypothetical protein
MHVNSYLNQRIHRSVFLLVNIVVNNGVNDNVCCRSAIVDGVNDGVARVVVCCGRFDDNAVTCDIDVRIAVVGTVLGCECNVPGGVTFNAGVDTVCIGVDFLGLLAIGFFFAGVYVLELFVDGVFVVVGLGL